MMKGDFSRNTFDPRNHYSRVLMQQGRVLLDADWNEQTDILLHNIRALTAELMRVRPHDINYSISKKSEPTFSNIWINPWDSISPSHGGNGFKIGQFLNQPEPPKDEPETDDTTQTDEQDPEEDILKNFFIGPGSYFVDGILCENEQTVIFKPTDGAFTKNEKTILSQPYFNPSIELKLSTRYLVYLEVWERHLTHIQQSQEQVPKMRDVALGGVDTASRSQVVWRVKMTSDGVDTQSKDIDKSDNFSLDSRFLRGEISGIPESTEYLVNWSQFVNKKRPSKNTQGKLKASIIGDKTVTDDNCIISPDSEYRGLENQLYRVEIHQGNFSSNVPEIPVTFKWSRENGSVVFPIRDKNGAVVELEYLNVDDRLKISEGDWVELLDDSLTLNQDVNPLRKVEKVDATTMKITLDDEVSINLEQNPIIRRWDHVEAAVTNDGAIAIGDDKTFELEDGIQVEFESGKSYQSGDYWLIPARTENGKIGWPGGEFVYPLGIKKHYAPLAIIQFSNTKDKEFKISTIYDCRRALQPLWHPNITPHSDS